MSRFSNLTRILGLVALGLLGGCGTRASDIERQPSGSAGAAPVSLAELGWLLGAWSGTGDGGERFEAIRVQDDSTFSIVYFTDSTCTAIRPVTGTVEERAGRIYHTCGAARWLATDGSPASLLFQPLKGADTRLRWSSERPTRRTAELMRTDSLGREVTRSWTFRRIDAADYPGAEHQRCARATP